jgi:predicted nuclease of predicted toxin-antitoxin system
MGVSSSVVRQLRERGHDAIHLFDLGLEKLADDAILDLARAQGRVVLTFDLDFGDLLATGRLAFPSTILFRLRDQTPRNVARRLSDIMEASARELERGALIIVEDARHRIRLLPMAEAGN